MHINIVTPKYQIVNFQVENPWQRKVEEPRFNSQVHAPTKRKNYFMRVFWRGKNAVTTVDD